MNILNISEISCLNCSDQVPGLDYVGYSKDFYLETSYADRLMARDWKKLIIRSSTNQVVRLKNVAAYSINYFPITITLNGIRVIAFRSLSKLTQDIVLNFPEGSTLEVQVPTPITDNQKFSIWFTLELTGSPQLITATPTSTPTISVTKTSTPTLTPTLSITPSTTQTKTPTKSLTPSNTPSVSISQTKTPTLTPTLTPGATRTPTLSLTATPTNSLSLTPTRSATATPTISITQSPTISITPSVSPTLSVTPTVTTSLSLTPPVSPTVSNTPTISITPTSTPTSTLTPTPTSTLTPTPTSTLKLLSNNACNSLNLDAGVITGYPDIQTFILVNFPSYDCLDMFKSGFSYLELEIYEDPKLTYIFNNSLTSILKYSIYLNDILNAKVGDNYNPLPNNNPSSPMYRQLKILSAQTSNTWSYSKYKNPVGSGPTVFLSIAPTDISIGTKTVYSNIPAITKTLFYRARLTNIDKTAYTKWFYSNYISAAVTGDFIYNSTEDIGQPPHDGAGFGRKIIEGPLYVLPTPTPTTSNNNIISPSVQPVKVKPLKTTGGYPFSIRIFSSSQKFYPLIYTRDSSIANSTWAQSNYHQSIIPVYANKVDKCTNDYYIDVVNVLSPYPEIEIFVYNYDTKTNKISSSSNIIKINTKSYIDNSSLCFLDIKDTIGYGEELTGKEGGNTVQNLSIEQGNKTLLVSFSKPVNNSYFDGKASYDLLNYNIFVSDARSSTRTWYSIASGLSPSDTKNVLIEKLSIPANIKVNGIPYYVRVSANYSNNKSYDVVSQMYYPDPNKQTKLSATVTDSSFGFIFDDIRTLTGENLQLYNSAIYFTFNRSSNIDNNLFSVNFKPQLNAVSNNSEYPLVGRIIDIVSKTEVEYIQPNKQYAYIIDSTSATFPYYSLIIQSIYSINTYPTIYFTDTSQKFLVRNNSPTPPPTPSRTPPPTPEPLPYTRFSLKSMNAVYGNNSLDLKLESSRNIGYLGPNTAFKIINAEIELQSTSPAYGDTWSLGAFYKTSIKNPGSFKIQYNLSLDNTNLLINIRNIDLVLFSPSHINGRVTAITYVSPVTKLEETVFPGIYFNRIKRNSSALTSGNVLLSYNTLDYTFNKKNSLTFTLYNDSNIVGATLLTSRGYSVAFYKERNSYSNAWTCDVSIGLLQFASSTKFSSPYGEIADSVSASIMYSNENKQSTTIPVNFILTRRI